MVTTRYQRARDYGYTVIPSKEFFYRAVKLEKVRAAGDFLISLMPLMFISPSVGLMTDFDAYKDILAPLLIICLVSTLVVMAVTGRISQAIIRRGSAKREAGR